MFILTIQESTEVAIEALKLKSFENAGIARKEDFDILTKSLTKIAHGVSKRLIADERIVLSVKDRLAALNSSSFLEKQNYLLSEELSQNGILKLASTVDCDKQKFIHNFFGILVADLSDALLTIEAKEAISTDFNSEESTVNTEFETGLQTLALTETDADAVDLVIDCSEDIAEQSMLNESAELVFYDETGNKDKTIDLEKSSTNVVVEILWDTSLVVEKADENANPDNNPNKLTQEEKSDANLVDANSNEQVLLSQEGAAADETIADAILANAWANIPVSGRVSANIANNQEELTQKEKADTNQDIADNAIRANVWVTVPVSEGASAEENKELDIMTVDAETKAKLEDYLACEGELGSSKDNSEIAKALTDAKVEYEKPSLEATLNKLNELASAELGSEIALDNKFALSWPAGNSILVIDLVTKEKVSEIQVNESSTIESIADSILSAI